MNRDLWLDWDRAWRASGLLEIEAILFDTDQGDMF